jgi:hypothetical protein
MLHVLGYVLKSLTLANGTNVPVLLKPTWQVSFPRAEHLAAIQEALPRQGWVHLGTTQGLVARPLARKSRRISKEFTATNQKVGCSNFRRATSPYSSRRPAVKIDAQPALQCSDQNS